MRICARVHRHMHTRMCTCIGARPQAHTCSSLCSPPLLWPKLMGISLWQLQEPLFLARYYWILCTQSIHHKQMTHPFEVYDTVCFSTPTELSGRRHVPFQNPQGTLCPLAVSLAANDCESLPVSVDVPFLDISHECRCTESLRPLSCSLFSRCSSYLLVSLQPCLAPFQPILQRATIYVIAFIVQIRVWGVRWLLWIMGWVRVELGPGIHVLSSPLLCFHAAAFSHVLFAALCPAEWVGFVASLALLTPSPAAY